MSDQEFFNLLEDGGVRLCDYAIEQWQSGKYTCGIPKTPEAFSVITENTMKFERAKQRVRLVVAELRRSAKDNK